MGWPKSWRPAQRAAAMERLVELVDADKRPRFPGPRDLLIVIGATHHQSMEWARAQGFDLKRVMHAPVGRPDALRGLAVERTRFVYVGHTRRDLVRLEEFLRSSGFKEWQPGDIATDVTP